MRSKRIKFNGVDVTCYEDGSVEWMHGRYKRSHRTFGCKTDKGYRHVEIGRKTAKVHRLIAQAYLSDWDESLQVDHIDGVKDSNQPENLRMTDENERCFRKKQANCSSDFIGVSWDKWANKWQARIRLKNGRTIAQYFDDEIEAAVWRDAQAKKDGRVQESLNSYSHPELSMLSGASTGN